MIITYVKNERNPITPYEARHMTAPEISTPRSIARADHFLDRLKSEAISPPVQAPVPGAGIATKSIRAINMPRVIGLTE